MPGIEGRREGRPLAPKRVEVPGTFPLLPGRPGISNSYSLSNKIFMTFKHFSCPSFYVLSKFIGVNLICVIICMESIQVMSMSLAPP